MPATGTSVMHSALSHYPDSSRQTVTIARKGQRYFLKFTSFCIISAFFRGFLSGFWERGLEFREMGGNQKHGFSEEWRERKIKGTRADSGGEIPEILHVPNQIESVVGYVQERPSKLLDC
ncbi:hypothetical protein AAC387_Pa10g1181 [Persea americana]